MTELAYHLQFIPFCRIIYAKVYAIIDQVCGEDALTCGGKVIINRWHSPDGHEPPEPVLESEPEFSREIPVAGRRSNIVYPGTGGGFGVMLPEMGYSQVQNSTFQPLCRSRNIAYAQPFRFKPVFCSSRVRDG